MPFLTTAWVWSREELEKLSAICLEKGVLVLSDEIHFDLILGERHHTVFATLSEAAAQNCVICTAPSKTFNLAGLQTANIIIPNKKLREKLLAVRNRLGIHGCNMLGYQACETAYRECEDWLEQLLAVLRENRTLVETYARAFLPGVKPVELAEIDGGSSGGGGSMTFAPVINIQGSADRGMVEEALAEAQARFEAWYLQMQRRQARTAY